MPFDITSLFGRNQQSKNKGVGPSDLLRGKLGLIPQEPVPSHAPVPPREWTVSGGHPAGVSEGPVEQAVKVMGGKFGSRVPSDDPYLEQYFHPEHNILERQPLRPTISSGKNENLPYRRLAIQSIFGPKQEVLQNYTDGKMSFDDLKNETTNNSEEFRRLNTLGLGQYKYDQSNPNYDSVYDEWDFDTKSPLTVAGQDAIPGAIIPNLYEYIAKTFMKKAGTPYAVYDRVPKDSLYDYHKIKK